MTKDWHTMRLPGPLIPGIVRPVKVIRLDAEARDVFLADLRLGILTLLRPSGEPWATPLWYGWDGKQVEMFSERRSAQVRSLESDPRAHVLVTNIPPEPARWVALEGRIRIRAESGQDTAERLTRRYLSRASDLEIAELLEFHRRRELLQLMLEPERIHTYAEIG
jgi:nitroimidazol reductase NimA-like FMN-containing flavoprotein (pyridoxamine 5'-phosphate oxidase superfamily)